MTKDADWLRSRIDKTFGASGQSGFARFPQLAGDHRNINALIRTINNATAGRHMLSGEMRVIANLLTRAAEIPGMISKAKQGPGEPLFNLLPPPEVSAAPAPKTKRARG